MRSTRRSRARTAAGADASRRAEERTAGTAPTEMLSVSEIYCYLRQPETERVCGAGCSTLSISPACRKQSHLLSYKISGEARGEDLEK